MARKYGSRRTPKKIEPAVMTLTFSTPSTSATRNYIDLSQVASIVNRRFYRQGLNWAVGGFKLSSARAGSVNIFKLPNTWVMSNAWEKGFRSWQRMNEEAMDETESLRPRFLDFKIYADDQHALAGSALNLMPANGGATGLAAPGEWDYSQIQMVSSPGDLAFAYDILATGASFPGIGASGSNSVSLIEGYASSRALPSIREPNMPGDADSLIGLTPENWMQSMFDEGTTQDDEVIGDLIEQNNQAPYPFENAQVPGAAPGVVFTDTFYPGGANQLEGLEWHDIVTIFETNVTNGVGIQRAKGGNFPCGLICIDHVPDSPANLVIQIDLIPGNHRGYLCEPMTEM